MFFHSVVKSRAEFLIQQLDEKYPHDLFYVEYDAIKIVIYSKELKCGVLFEQDDYGNIYAGARCAVLSAEELRDETPPKWIEYHPFKLINLLDPYLKGAESN